MLDTPHIIETIAQSTAVIHITTPRDKIREVMGPGYTELTTTLRAQGIEPAGPWFNHHLSMTPDVFDFELGVPVNDPVSPTGRVAAGRLPATTAARTIYYGPYEGLPAAWGEFEAWIVSQGLKSAPSLWETYLTASSTNPDPAMHRTELTRPILSTPKP